MKNIITEIHPDNDYKQIHLSNDQKRIFIDIMNCIETKTVFESKQVLYQVINCLDENSTVNKVQ